MDNDTGGAWLEVVWVADSSLNGTRATSDDSCDFRGMSRG